MNGQVVHKMQPSSFTDTDLKEHIDKLGKKKLVLAGNFPLFPSVVLSTYVENESLTVGRLHGLKYPHHIETSID